MTYKFILNREIIKGRPGLTLYTGNQSSYRFEFSFDKEWDNLQKFITFSDGENTYVLPLTNNIAAVPSELLLEPGSFFFGVYASTDSNEIKRVSSNIVNVTVLQGAYSDGTKPAEPTKELWESLISKSVPIIGDNGNWQFWDFTLNKYIDSEKLAVPQHDDTEILNRITQLEEKNAKKQDSVTGIISADTAADITLADNTEYIYKSSLDSLTVTMPENLTSPFISSVIFDSEKPATKFNISAEQIFYCGADCTETDFSPSANKHYTMIFTYDLLQTICYVSATPINSAVLSESTQQKASDLPYEIDTELDTSDTNQSPYLFCDDDGTIMLNTSQSADMHSESDELAKIDNDTEVIS